MNIKKLISFAAALVVSSAAYGAEEWGIDGEKKARFEAKVVDIACELSGNCPENCGAGKRQLGLLKDDGELILAIKNFDIFAGASADLLAFCGKRIVADGLMIKTAHMPVFALQFKRLAPDGKWGRANGFSKNWAKSNPGKKANEWFRHDVAVINELNVGGVFGIPGLKPPPE